MTPVELQFTKHRPLKCFVLSPLENASLTTILLGREKGCQAPKKPSRVSKRKEGKAGRPVVLFLEGLL